MTKKRQPEALHESRALGLNNLTTRGNLAGETTSPTKKASAKNTVHKSTGTALDSRLVARAPKAIVDLIKEAADFAGVSLSQFLMDSAVNKAKTVIAEEREIYLTAQSAHAVFAAIEHPPAPNSRLLAAAAKYEERKNGFTF